MKQFCALIESMVCMPMIGLNTQIEDDEDDDNEDEFLNDMSILVTLRFSVEPFPLGAFTVDRSLRMFALEFSFDKFGSASLVSAFSFRIVGLETSA